MNSSVLRKTLHVLIIEDSKSDRRILSEMLTHAPFGSFDFNITGDFEAAVQLLKTESYDVALLDLNLDGSKGISTLKKLSKLFPQLPIVVNTGAYQDDLGLMAITSGAQDYLIKGNYKAYGLSKSLYYAIERKRSELELQQAYERLKETQSQLIQAEKMSVVGGVASGIAHEVKNPLATIIYGIEYLTTKLSSKDETIDLTLSSIKKAAQKANDIIKDLLDFASVSMLNSREENLNQVILDSLNFTRYHFETNCITVIKEFDPHLPEVSIDKNRIEQVFVDLFFNAIYAMKSNGTLTIRTYKQEFSSEILPFGKRRGETIKSGDPVIIVDIKDTGPGIAEENITKIFDPFFTTRRAQGGVGLGLSIARTIVTNHHGLISVNNDPEGGAIARIIFKL